VAGKFLSIIACTSKFKVEMDREGRSVAVAGSQLSKADGFAKLNFSETEGADNVITFDVSDTPSPGRATVVAANSSTFVGANSGLYDLASTFTFPGVDALGRHRKSITVSNTGRSSGGTANGGMAILAVGAALNAACFAVSNLTIETDSNIDIAGQKQDLSGPVVSLMVYVLEIFYSKPLQTDQ